jgi:CubicO group peptidase (beta-lactamase class C family)
MFLLSGIIVSGIFGFVWETETPEHLGMDQDKLEEARDYALTGGGSGCIIRGGKMVMAWGDQQQKYDLYSTTKSIGGIALAFAMTDGKVSLNDRMIDHLSDAGVPPESNKATGWLEKITLLHLATHTAGFEKTRGWCELHFEPGTGWLYSDGGTNWLADCLTVAYKKDLLDLMIERVFEPLEITVGDSRDGDEDLFWGFNNLDRPRELNGIPRRPFNAGIHANVQAMAKIGYLHLRRGRWGDQQIISESFIDMARTTVPSVLGLPVKEDTQNRFGGASDHYGILWWNNADGAMPEVPHDAYWSWGLKESLIVVIPSLDLVIARAGRDGWQRDSWGSGYPVIEPFIRPVCESIAERDAQPYPQSTYISGMTFGDIILDKDVNGPDYASGDQWAGTWADDGHMYMGWGDGTGFGHRGGWRDRWTSFMGLARIEGMPPNHQGFDVWGGYESESQSGALYVNQEPQTLNLKPGDGLIFLNGTMYWYAERKSDGRLDCQLWTSTDYGRNWTDHGRFFQENGKFAFTGVIQFGQNYSDFPSDLGKYLYMFDGGTKNENHPHYSRTGMLLARIPLNDLLNRDAVEFFDGTPGNPSWASDIHQAKPVFEDQNGVNAQVSCTYNKAIGRYILLTTHKVVDVKEGFGIFESEWPWGPWRTVYYTDNLDEFVPGLTNLINVSAPSKWVSDDGKTLWLVFSGRPSDPMYSFNLIQVILDVGM